MIQGVLLAAGAGVRFGGHKLLQPLADGTPMGVAAARQLLTVLPGSLAVVRAGDRRLAHLLSALGMRVIPCPTACRGMGASLAWAVTNSPAAHGWVVALGDMPFVRAASIAAVAEALRAGAPLVAPTYDDQRGHPVGFDRTFSDPLRRLDGDRGARDLLHNHEDLLTRLPVEDAGVLVDVDQRAQLV